MNKKYLIRLATVDDVESIRCMQAQSWCENYRNDQLGVTAGWLKAYTDAWLTPESLAESKRFLVPLFKNNQENFYIESGIIRN